MKKKKIHYIPLRFVLAILFSVIEVLCVIGGVVLLCAHIPLCFFLAVLVHFFCVLQILSSEDNADYKLPWILCVVLLPIVGFMLYFMFYSRKLRPRFVRRLFELTDKSYRHDDEGAFCALREESATAAAQAALVARTTGARLFRDTRVAYFASGEEMLARLLCDLRGAQRFIFLSYFIIEEGVFWDAILAVLQEKAKAGVEVRVLYDDIGCMKTLPGNYDKILARYGIDASPFARLCGQANSEFNNRNHR